MDIPDIFVIAVALAIAVVVAVAGKFASRIKWGKLIR